MIDPKDIPDPKIRQWYEEHNTKIVDTQYAELSGFQHIWTSGLACAFQHGYYEWVSLGYVDKNNEYVQYILSLRENPESMTKYDKMDLQDIIDTSIERFGIARDIINNGFDSRHPIILYSYQYPRKKNHFTISVKGEKIHFNVVDGHHRIICSHMANISSVPIVRSEMKHGKIDIDHILRMTVKNQWRWYQPIDFGPGSERISFQNPDNHYHGKKKFDFIIDRNLGDIKGQIILDLGCNTGIISACMAQKGADLVIGLDKPKKIEQAKFVHHMLWRSYGNIVFRNMDISDVELFNKFMNKTPHIDWVVMSNFIYYMGDKVDTLMEIISRKCKHILIQGNSLKRDQQGNSSARLDYSPSYRGEYSSIVGMSALLSKYGYSVRVDAPRDYSKPVVVGKK